MDRGAWQAEVHVVSKGWIGLWNQHYHFHIDTMLKKERKEKKNIFLLVMRTLKNLLS